MSDRTQIDHLEGLLQPDILIELGASVSGPLDLLQLRDCLEERHLSEDGASGQSEPTIERSIQFKAETWRALSRLADQLEERGTPGLMVRLPRDTGTPDTPTNRSRPKSVGWTARQAAL